MKMGKKPAGIGRCRALPAIANPGSPLPLLLLACLLPWTGALTRSASAAIEPAVPFPVSIRVDAARPVGEMKPIWRFFGADEPNYSTMKDGRRLLAELGELRPQGVFFRSHNLL